MSNSAITTTYSPRNHFVLSGLASSFPRRRDALSSLPDAHGPERRFSNRIEKDGIVLAIGQRDVVRYVAANGQLRSSSRDVTGKR